MKKGVTTNDPLADDDEKGIATVYTPDGTQQMTVQHIPDEWRRVGSVPTPGVDGMGLNGCAPRGGRKQSGGAILRCEFGQSGNHHATTAGARVPTTGVTTWV